MSKWIVLLGLAAVLIVVLNQLNFQQKTSAVAPSQNPGTAEIWTLYDPDPNHIWNRLYRTLYRRESRHGHAYGYDELDPLLWVQTKYLLTDPAHHQAVTVLDEFLSTHGEKAINDPVKRAILQRDLWAIFDWTTECFECIKRSAAQLNLQTKLAQAIKRLALSPEQIATLPDTNKQAINSGSLPKAYD